MKLLGRKLLLEGTNEVAYQHSSDLLIELSLSDGTASPFYGMLLAATVKTPDKDVVSCPIIEESGKKYIQLAGEALSTDGYVKLSVGGINDNRIVITSNTIDLCVDESNNIVTQTSPNEKYWQIEVRNAIRYWYDTQIKPQYDALKATVSTLIERDEELQDNIAKTEEAVNETLSDVNEAIEQSSEAAQNANTAASDANEAALAACAAKTNADTAAASANTAASNANTAAQSANDIASEVERKLQAGEFVGGVGPVGPKGDKGDKGNDGDDGGDTLPIGAQVLWDNSNPIPEGWKEVDTEVHNPKQLLINNDFQINQRGQSEYNFIENGKYGLDMWQQRQGEFSNALIVKPVDDGVELTCQPNVFGGLRQFLSLSAEDIGKEYTVCISVNNVRQTGTFTLLSESQTVFENEIYRVGITRLTGDGYALSILLSNENTREAVNTINYVDLFEGNVDYPHVKEDEAIALMKCRQYVFVTAQKKLAGKVGTGHLEGFDFPIKMKGAPTYTVVAFETTGGADIKRELKSVSCTSRGVAYMTLQSPTQQEYQYTILFSCEPL